tara:strand:- start:500 stop:988 length:489 start_codon:yes stop_codon:yes gene_type:complete
MGSGKSVIGKSFAKEINYKFVDTDKLIEKKTGKTISHIFSKLGEDHFRDIEFQEISKLLGKKNYVISLGGGTILNNNLRNIIKKNSFNVYLKVNIDTLTKRLEKSKNRPLIQNKDIKEVLSNLMKKREKYYEKADLIIYNQYKISDTIKELKTYFKINEKNY